MVELPEVMWPEVTGRDRKSQKWSRAHPRIFPAFIFLTRVVQNVGTRFGHVTPKGWTGTRMPNRKLGFPAVFSGVLTGNDVPVGEFPRVRTYATGSWGFLPIRESFPRTFFPYFFKTKTKNFVFILFLFLFFLFTASFFYIFFK